MHYRFLLDPTGMPNLTAAGGIAGTLMTWLLQYIRSEDCGVELGTVYKSVYPGYPICLLLFAVSTSICLFFTNTSSIYRIPVYYVVFFNMVAMLDGLIYMVAMCRSFLLNQHRRKRYVHRYLQSIVQERWKKEKYLVWNTVEAEQLISDFPDSVQWKRDNPVEWFFQEWIGRLAQIEEGFFDIWLQESEDLFVLIKQTCGNHHIDKIMGCAIAALIKKRNIQLNIDNQVASRGFIMAYRGFVMTWSAAVFSDTKERIDIRDRLLEVFQCVSSAMLHAVHLIGKMDNDTKLLVSDAIYCCTAILYASTDRFTAQETIEAYSKTIPVFFDTYRKKYVNLGLTCTSDSLGGYKLLAERVKRAVGKRTSVDEPVFSNPDREQNPGGFGGIEEPKGKE